MNALAELLAEVDRLVAQTAHGKTALLQATDLEPLRLWANAVRARMLTGVHVAYGLDAEYPQPMKAPCCASCGRPLGSRNDGEALCFGCQLEAWSKKEEG